MIEGRRAWVERVHAEGGTFKSGRKTGAQWVTQPMRARALEEARKLTGGWCPPFGPQDRKLVLALLGSAEGCPKARERAKELLRAVAMQRAASPSPCYVGLIAMAEQRLRERRALGQRVGPPTMCPARRLAGATRLGSPSTHTKPLARVTRLLPTDKSGRTAASIAS